MTTPCVLVLDQGGHSTRALVFDHTGKIIAQARVAIATYFPFANSVEQNPDDILQSLREVIDAIAQQLRDHCHQIIGAALIVQRSSLLAINEKTGEPLSPVLSWQDTRHADWLTKATTNRQKELRRYTGLYPNAHYGASKVRWLLDQPAIQQAVENDQLCITPLAGFLCRALTGQKRTVVDAVIASRMLLTELAASQWSQQLLTLFSIPEQVLPAIQPTLADYGCFFVGDTCVPLRLLGGDQSFFIFAHEKYRQPDTVFINAGTGAFVQQIMPLEQVPVLLLNSVLMVKEHAVAVSAAEGTVNAASTALDWFWLHNGVEPSAMDWCEADKICKKTESVVPLFINRVTATGSPDWLPAGESFFTQETSVPLQAIAVLESIVFALQRNMDVMQTVQPYRQVVVSGGLSQLDIFCQRLADMSGVAVLCSCDTEACARGAALQLLPGAVGDMAYQEYLPSPCVGLHERYQQWSLLMDQLSLSGRDKGN